MICFIPRVALFHKVMVQVLQANKLNVGAGACILRDTFRCRLLQFLTFSLSIPLDSALNCLVIVAPGYEPRRGFLLSLLLLLQDTMLLILHLGKKFLFPALIDLLPAGSCSSSSVNLDLLGIDLFD